MLHDHVWTHAEKQMARKAFDAAYSRECKEILKKTKEMVEKASDAPGLWRVHDLLTEERRRTDDLYDYRYSVLITVFARLIKDGRMTEDELAGLSADKLQQIQSLLAFRQDFENG